MSSTSISKILVEVRNLSLSLKIPTYNSSTLKDQFVSFTKRRSMATKNQKTILNNMSFNIHEGDRLGILGVNGTGKTTLCRCIAGLYNPTRGSILRHGQIRGIFDTATAMYPELTGRENARLLMHFLYPECPERHEELVHEALRFSELQEFLDTPYRIYSNGMQARLYLSLISCLPSDVLILDEVFEGADKFFREKISRRILSLIEKSGAVIFVSHSVEQVFRVCNRVLVIDDHQIKFDGDVSAGIQLYWNLGLPDSRQVLQPAEQSWM